MSDWRYHVASLSACLLCLAIGLMLGALYLSPTVPDYLKNRLTELEKRIDERANETQDLRNQIDRYREAVNQLDAPASFSGRHLSGRRLAIVQTGDYDEATTSVERAIEAAGGRADAIIRVGLRELLPDEERLVWTNLATALSGAPQSSMSYLHRRAGIAISGRINGRPDAVIVVGGFDRLSPDDDLTQLATKERAAVQVLIDSGIFVVGAEPLVCKEPSNLKSLRIPSVSAVDLNTGRALLVEALANPGAEIEP
ncbi:MAG: copper transporter [Armatimonadetes bacterium]|nr:copper transporter [Armatimonadota bacterium]